MAGNPTRPRIDRTSVHQYGLRVEGVAAAATALWRARSSGFSVAALRVPAPTTAQTLKCSDRRSLTFSGIARPGFRWPLEPRWRPAATPSHPRTQQTSAHLTNQTSQRSEDSLTSATSCREEPVFPDLSGLETQQHQHQHQQRRRESRGPPPGSRSISRPPNNPNNSPHTQHRASDAKFRALGFGRVGHQKYTVPTSSARRSRRETPGGLRTLEMNSTRSSQRRSPGAGEPGPPPNVPPRSISPAVGVGTNRPVAPRSSTASRSMQQPTTTAGASGSRNDGTRRANVSPHFRFPFSHADPHSTAGFMRRPTRHPDTGFNLGGVRHAARSCLRVGYCRRRCSAPVCWLQLFTTTDFDC